MPFAQALLNFLHEIFSTELSDTPQPYCHVYEVSPIFCELNNPVIPSSKLQIPLV